MRRSKYHSIKLETPDGLFDSKKEHERWLELKDMQSNGIISDLDRQVLFELIPAHKLPRPIKKGRGRTLTERKCTYLADFVYKQNGEVVVEDAKGFRTPEYIIKRKLMLDRYGIQISEV